MPGLYEKFYGRESAIEKLNKSWKNAVGAKTNKMAKPVRIKEKILYVNVYNSAWLYDIKIKKESIIEALNVNMGDDAVKDITFRVGKI